jgi:uncharacterized membrane protein (DUF2068 family)
MIRKHFAAGLRAVAIFEAIKGVLVLIVGFGLVSLLHNDAQHAVEKLIEHLHLNVAGHFRSIFADTLEQLTNMRLWLLSTAALSYATVRAIEAYGLWHERPWAEWFAALSGAVYIPFEIMKLQRHVTWLGIALLAANVAIIAFMLMLRFHALRARRAAAKGTDFFPPRK